MDEMEGVSTPAQEPTTEVKVYSDVEQQAMKQGWKPKEEFASDDAAKKWKTAEEFIKDGKYIEEIVSARKETKRVKEQLEILTEHWKKREQQVYERALAKAEQAKQYAIAENDAQAYQAAAQKVNQIQEEYKTQNYDAHVASQIPQEIREWQDNNPWFEDTTSSVNMDKTAVANQYWETIRAKNPNLSNAEKLQLLDRLLGEKFKSSATSPTTVKGKVRVDVEPGLETGEVNRITWRDLDQYEKEHVLRMEKNGVMTRQEWLNYKNRKVG